MPSENPEQSDSHEQLVWLDQLCDRFEDAWGTWKQFSVESVLRELASERHADVLRALLPLEIELRDNSGQPVTPQELAERFPVHIELIREVLSAPKKPDSLAGGETVPPKGTPVAESPTNGGLRIPRLLGRYRILRKLGQGAMGSVFLAHDEQLDRDVALKIPRGDVQRNSELRTRFLREAQAAASLNHPGICPIYDIGEFEGIQFICMAYIEGFPLTRYAIAESGLSEQRIAELVLKLAESLIVAHKAGFIHRDLKPANVMVNENDEPVILDFGLARRIDRNEETRLTQTGTPVGSPAYMSPEQVDGDSEKIDHRTDIYSLGVILYELLTGCIPFDGSMARVLGQIMTVEPEKPSKYRSELTVRLENICLRMMAKDPGKRYPSARAVAAALQEYLEKYSGSDTTSDVDESSDGSHAEVDRGAQRRKRIEGLIRSGDYAQAEKLLVALSRETEEDLLDAATWAAGELPGLRKTREEVRAGRQEIYSTAVRLMKAHDYEQAVRLLEEYPYDMRTPKMQDLLEQAEGRVHEIERLRKEIRRARQRADNRELLSLVLQLLEIKPGDRRAKELHERLTARAEGPISAMLGTRQPGFVKSMGVAAQWLVLVVLVIAVCGYPSYQWAKDYLGDSSDGTTGGGSSGERPSGEGMTTALPSGAVDLIESLHSSGIGLSGGWEWQGQSQLSFVGPGGTPLLFPDELPDSYRLNMVFDAAEDLETLVIVLPVRDSTAALVLRNDATTFGGLEKIDRQPHTSGPAAVTHAVIPSPGIHLGIEVMTDGDETSIRATAGGSDVLEWKGKTSRLSLNGNWDPGGGPHVAIGASHDDAYIDTQTCVVSELWFQPAETQATTSDEDGSLSPSAVSESRLPDGPPGLMGRLEGHTDTLMFMAVSPDSRHVVSSAYDGRCLWWDVVEQKLLTEIDARNSKVYCGAFLDDGKKLLLGGTGKTVILLDTLTWNVVGHFKGHTASVDELSVVPGDEQFISLARDGTARLWDIVSEKELKQHRFPDYSNEKRWVEACRTKDGKLLTGEGVYVSNQFNNWLIGPDLSVEKFSATPPHLDRLICREAADALRTSAVFAKAPGAKLPPTDVTEFDLNSGATRKLGSHSEHVTCVRYRPDGSMVISAARDDRIRVWDSTPVNQLAEFELPKYSTPWLAVSPDSRFVLSADRGKYDADTRKFAGTGDYGIDVWRLPQPAETITDPLSAAAGRRESESGVVNLLEHVSYADKDSAGTWKKYRLGGGYFFKNQPDGKLVDSRMAFPYALPQRYRLVCDYTRNQGDDSLSLGFSVGSSQTQVVVDSHPLEGGRTYLSGPDKTRINEVRGRQVIDQKRQRLVIDVQAMQRGRAVVDVGISGILDSLDEPLTGPNAPKLKTVIHWEGDPQTLAMWNPLHPDNGVSVGVHKSQYSISRLDLVTGAALHQVGDQSDDDSRVITIGDARVDVTLRKYDDQPLTKSLTRSALTNVGNEKTGAGRSEPIAVRVEGKSTGNAAWGLHFQDTKTTEGYRVLVQGRQLSITRAQGFNVTQRFATVTVKQRTGWRTLEMVVDGQEIRVFLDGEPVVGPVNIKQPVFTGNIDLAMLGPGRTEFRNLVIGKVLAK